MKTCLFLFYQYMFGHVVFIICQYVYHVIRCQYVYHVIICQYAYDKNGLSRDLVGLAHKHAYRYMSCKPIYELTG